MVLLAVVMAGAGIGVYLWLSSRNKQPANGSPMPALAAITESFPLYYPKQLPSGFHLQNSSVSQPQSGVVVFDAIGLKNQKIYFSEEARPTTYDIGGFYAKFQDLKEVGVSDGAIAVGRISDGGTEIAGRANNLTWILSNTNAQIPLGQLVTMLKSITQVSQ